MKIRTDFVTNSSSSSFVLYQLDDSEFCRYVYELMQSKGLSYKERSSSRARSLLTFRDDFLDAEISVDGLYCDKYAPEEYEPEFNVDIDASDIVDHLESVDENFWFDSNYDCDEFTDKFYDEHYSDNIDDAYRDDHGSGHYYVYRISYPFCEALFNLICTHEHDDTITEYNGGYRCRPCARSSSVMDVYPDSIILLTNGSDSNYGGREKESDISTMTAKFLSLISEFLPLDEIGEEEKLAELFKQDKENGKFNCDVYMGNTD